MVACGAQRGRGSGLVYFEFDGAVDRRSVRDFAGLFSFLSSGPTGGHVRGLRVSAAKPVWRPTPGFRCSSPSLKAPRRQGPGASSLVVLEGVLSLVGRSERGSGSRSELVSLVWPL